ncbi:hypothetical protein [Nonomuraea indica]|uniref:Uncharacterized protein n=1 Tax=Nonomuraea indica TaxID=1581193 RepID=A0ABW8A8N8_9ACTN
MQITDVDRFVDRFVADGFVKLESVVPREVADEGGRCCGGASACPLTTRRGGGSRWCGRRI